MNKDAILKLQDKTICQVKNAGVSFGKLYD